MLSNSSITIQLYPNQDQLIIYWLKAMQESRPRFASVYAREALHYYIITGKYLNLGSIAARELPEKSSLCITKDDTLIKWMDDLTKRKLKAAPFARSILSKCISLSDDDKDHLPDFIDIMQPRIDLQQQGTLPPSEEPPKTPPDATEMAKASTEKEISSEAVLPAAQPKLPKNKRKSSIIDKLGSNLE